MEGEDTSLSFLSPLACCSAEEGLLRQTMPIALRGQGVLGHLVSPPPPPQHLLPPPTQFHPQIPDHAKCNSSNLPCNYRLATAAVPGSESACLEACLPLAPPRTFFAGAHRPLNPISWP